MHLNAGPAVRVGQFLEFSVSPFISINSRTQLRFPDNEIDPKFLFPSTVKDMYKPFDLGGQTRLTLRLNIGKHFNVNVQVFAGMTFTDMRKDDWTDARAFVQFAAPGEEWIPLGSSKLTRRFHGIMLGFGIK